MPSIEGGTLRKETVVPLAQSDVAPGPPGEVARRSAAPASRSYRVFMCGDEGDGFPHGDRLRFAGLILQSVVAGKSAVPRPQALLVVAPRPKFCG